jgi:hypothetical protein
MQLSSKIKIFLYGILFLSSSVLAESGPAPVNAVVMQNLSTTNDLDSSVSTNNQINQDANSNVNQNLQIAPSVVLVPSSNAERYVADCFKSSEYKYLTHYPSVSLFQ